ncbi:MAG TPA: DUF721 domain-containing protein, partial [Streptomyces sp.]|nr:DUF721 domain-containing protein [Streptomyces sp.]
MTRGEGGQDDTGSTGAGHTSNPGNTPVTGPTGATQPPAPAGQPPEGREPPESSGVDLARVALRAAKEQ